MREHRPVEKSPPERPSPVDTPGTLYPAMMNPIRSALRHAAGVCAVLCCTSGLWAQRPAHFEHPDADLVHAQELFDKAQYGAAQYEFERVVDRITAPHSGTRITAEYHSAICAVRLFHDDAEHRMAAFIDRHPESPYVQSIYLELFRHASTRKRYKEVLAWAAKVDEYGLAAADRAEFNFKKGYAHFQNDEYDRALVEFTKVKDDGSMYVAPARYYTAHIHYTRRNYEAALQGFESLASDPAFAKVVPYYIAQIQFLQGRYDALLGYVEPLLAEGGEGKRSAEINRLAGEAYFRTGQYAKAVPYLEKSVARNGADRGDHYITGYALYKEKGYKKAIDQFIRVVNNVNDSLSQLASYHMADCYLKLGEKTYARNAFKKAYELGQDPRITEDALFNYAKLSYELSFDPYNEAVIALSDYMKRFPNSPRHDEAQEFLLDVYIKTRNHEAALKALDAIRNKDIRLRGAYQKLAYSRGAELYEGRKFNDAIKAFGLSLTHPIDPKVTAMAHYWTAESYYAQAEYTAALHAYEAVRNTTGAYAFKLYEQAGYGMGYSYFKQRRYGEAATAFRRFVDAAGISAEQRTDAFVRIGDSYFVQKELATAVSWYDKALAANTPARDYAMYQKGVCQGLDRKPEQKIATLKKLLADRPTTAHAADAKFELGETYLGLEKDADALVYYTQVIDQHPNSPNVRQSMLQAALIKRRQGRTEEAIAAFKDVVKRYPDMESARDALAGLESIYVDQGRVAEYDSYVRSLTFFDASTLDLDEKYYRSAEVAYNNNKCDAAVGGFQDYLAKYPNGAYTVNARFYASDCLYRNGKYDEALPGFERTIQDGAVQFLEPALYAASDIVYRAERWETAITYFTELEKVAARPANVLVAQTGLLRSLVRTGRNAAAADVADRLLRNPELKSNDVKAEAQLAKAQAQLDRNELDAAYTAFRQVAQANKNIIGAQAKFNMAYIRYLQKRYGDTEKEVFALMDAFGGHEPWRSKAFVVLGDAYLQQNDRFQARATWDLVVANGDDEATIATAQDRLRALDASEVRQGTPENPEEISIPERR